MEITVTAYLIYLPTAISLTLMVAHKLFQNSKVFMLDIFNGREAIAYSTNNLFRIGFYLMNLGVALLILEMYGIHDTMSMVEALSFKVGGFSIYLGVMLFLNLFLFFRGKRKAAENRRKHPAVKPKPITNGPSDEFETLT